MDYNMMGGVGGIRDDVLCLDCLCPRYYPLNPRHCLSSQIHQQKIINPDICS